MENNTLDNTDISRHLGKASEYKDRKTFKVCSE